MRTALALLIALASAGCANVVTRATPQELIDAPGARAGFESQRPIGAAYRKTLAQMKSCYERKLGLTGTAQWTVFGDQDDQGAQVSWAASSMFGYKVLATISLSPRASGTSVMVYFATDHTPDFLIDALKAWINDDMSGCPGDAGFADRLAKP